MLTGRFRFRKGWFGRCVLQVQERVTGSWGMSCGDPALYRWRDADQFEAYDFMIKLGGCLK